MTKLTLAIMAATAIAYGVECGQVTGLTAVQHDGITFVYGTEPVTGAGGATYRYRLYRSTSQITSTVGAELIQDEKAMYNNGAIYYGKASGASITQTVRQNASAVTLALTDGGASLPAYTALGVSINLATESAYYAITTVSTDASCTESSITVGTNSLTSAVEESPAPNVPVRQQLDNGSSSKWDGSTGHPLLIHWVGSGGSLPFSPLSCSGTCGDRYAWFAQGSGASRQGYEPGQQSAFLVYQDRTHGSVLWNSHHLVFAAQDLTPAPSGNNSWESSWRGFYTDASIGVGSLGNKFYRFTENRFAAQIAWARSHYGTHATKIVCQGASMGTFSAATGWPLTSGVCATFIARPAVLNRANYMTLLSSGTAVNHNTVPALSPTTHKMADDDTTAYEDYYAVSRLTARAQSGQHVPFYVISAGRTDICCGVDGYPGSPAAWYMTYTFAQLANSLRLGYVIAWNNGSHSATPTLTELYGQKFPLATNESYPALTNFSLDNDIGNGSTTVGDCASGVSTCWWNKGWAWSAPSETSTTWTIALSNSEVTGSPATVDVTPRNSQSFAPADGQRVTWATSAGQTGESVVDGTLHVATATGVSIPSGGTTITFTAADPTLTVAPATLNYTCTSGGSVPGAQSIAVSLTGAGATLDDWSASKTQSWLTLTPASGSAAGSFSASVDCSGLAVGNYSDTVTVSSTTSGITGSPQTVSVAVTAIAGPSISTESLPNVAAASAYSQTLAAVGGAEPYTWSIISGSLCLGMSLNAASGAITGTPMIAGTCAFTARVTDSNLAPGDRAMSIQVTPSPHTTARGVEARGVSIR